MPDELIAELERAARGDAAALDAIFPQVYRELKRLARRELTSEKAGHTLQTTALVHEAFLRLVGAAAEPRLAFDSRAHFFGAAARAMRQVLIEAARRKATDKRGGGAVRLELAPDGFAAPEMNRQLLDLDEALTRLAAVEPRVAEIVTLKYFGGMTVPEIAAALGVSPRTVDADWAYARAWLSAELKN
jgi:RNA polymerase sigma factor (TIGR02999 family)